jgi:hypothetical protein
MGQKFPELTEKHIQFIAEQKIYFVGTATADSKVNISPKGTDSLRVLSKNSIAWLNLTGSGNETSAHVQIDPRMTIMFAAFEGKPVILRLYGKATVIHQNDDEWESSYRLFNPLPGARQIFKLAIDMVQSSCGMSIPFFDYVSEREELNNWASKSGQEGMSEYWRKKNHTSIDGIPTQIVEKSFKP